MFTALNINLVANELARGRACEVST